MSANGPAEHGGQTWTAPFGTAPTTRRQRLTKAAWLTVWLVFLGGPAHDLLHGEHTPLGTTLCALGLAAFVAVYFALVFRHTLTPLPARVRGWALALLFVLATALSAGAGPVWLVLYVYLAVASGAVLHARQAALCIGATLVLIVALGTQLDGEPGSEVWTSLVLPALLGGFAMVSARRTLITLKELRAARAAVARLAANEERLRLARDLHDLLGHSLSLITLKSELAGRMLPDQAERAAEQVADIERVSRQALVDVREAVGGYRRPTLAVELAGARTTLAAAGIAADLPTAPEPDEHPYADLAVEQEGALAWALREAVTNVVRHSGATRCAVALAGQADDTVCLTVTDNGRGPSGRPGEGRGSGAGDGTGAGGGTGAARGGGGPGGSGSGSGAGFGSDSGLGSGSGPGGTGGSGSSGGSGEGHGLAGLRERLALAGGSLETSAGVRGGFTLRATVPTGSVT